MSSLSAAERVSQSPRYSDVLQGVLFFVDTLNRARLNKSITISSLSSISEDASRSLCQPMKTDGGIDTNS